ncbi:MAG: hypothetical protein FWE21_02340 [Defluviitaleaceae bacterium]|nr:hypothetical protein [Defluviitaleaceae bacterium]
MSKEYIPVTTSETVYFKPQTKEEMETMTQQMKLGDMMFLPWMFSNGMW